MTTATILYYLLPILKTFLLAHTLVKFEPIVWILDAISGIFYKWKVTGFIFNLFYTAITCQKCAALYIGFLVGGFWTGIVSSFISYIWIQLISPKIDRIRLQ